MENSELLIKLFMTLITAIGVPTLGLLALLIRAVIKNSGSSKLVAEGQTPLADAISELTEAVKDDARETKNVAKKMDDLSGDHDAIMDIKGTVHRLEGSPNA